MGTIPEHLRAGVSEQLDALVRGDLPELLTWVTNYGDAGTTLVPQPDAVWTHRLTDAMRTNEGGWHIVVPLWTSDESPSDLSAELLITAGGEITIADVHVL